MKILAIDTSCDESCAAIVDTATHRLLSDVVHSHVGAMAAYGGVVPEIASREHVKGLPLAVHEALERAGLSPRDIDWIAVTNRPGLIGALLVGVAFAKSMAFVLGKPFSVINHIEAHLFSPLLATLEGAQVPPFPWIALVVSGGHTELFHVRKTLDYDWLGGTVDDAAGEAFDKIGKLLSLPYPAGPSIDRLVREKALPEHFSAFSFPRAKTQAFHFSFSGLKTAVAQQVKKIDRLSDPDTLRLATCAQEAIVDALVAQVSRAQEQLGVQQVVVTGGVACNSRLRAKMPQAYFPKPKHCTDNAAMVAVLALLQEKAGCLKPASFTESASPVIIPQDATPL